MKTIIHIELTDQQRLEIAENQLGKSHPRHITRAWVTEKVNAYVESLLTGSKKPAPREATPDHPEIVRPQAQALLRRYYDFLDDSEKERLWKRAVGLED